MKQRFDERYAAIQPWEIDRITGKWQNTQVCRLSPADNF